MSSGIIEVDQDRSSNRAIMAEMGSSREVAEIQSQMIIAKKFPRDEQQALDRILTACQRKTLADAAVYQYARGGTDITGPSIRLAETLARCWGNLQFGLRELEQRNGESTVEAFAIDLETNVRCAKVFQVKHIRNTRSGDYKLTDSRDIYELVANQGARRMRACILGVIPGDVIDAAVAECESTLNTNADMTPERIKAMLEKFAAMSVTKEMIEARLQRRLDAMTPAQFVNLRKVYNSMKDGMSTANDWFQDNEPKAAPSSVNDKLKGAKAKPVSDTAQASDPQDA